MQPGLAYGFGRRAEPNTGLAPHVLFFIFYTLVVPGKATDIVVVTFVIISK